MQFLMGVLLLLAKKNGTNLGIENICFDSDKVDKSNSQVNLRFLCKWRKFSLLYHRSLDPLCLKKKGQVTTWPSEDALEEDVFSPQDPSQPLPDAIEPTTRVKYQNVASGMEETQWLSCSSIVWASEWAVSLLGLCKSHSDSHPPASFTDIFLKSFLVCLLAPLPSGFLGRICWKCNGFHP